jgi:hypothetical protein
MMKTSTAVSLGFLLAYGEWEILTIFAKYVIVYDFNCEICARG